VDFSIRYDVDMSFPAPPATAPLVPHGQISQRTVLAVASRILRGWGFTSAARAERVTPDIAHWRDRAARGDDPFWPWAVAVVEQAQAEAIGAVEEAHYAAATGVEDAPCTPGAIQAQRSILAARSEDFADRPSGPSGAGSVSVTIGNLALLLEGRGASPAAVTSAAWEPPVLDAAPDGDDTPAAPVPARKMVSFRRS
jgi:hypothetical protein